MTPDAAPPERPVPADIYDARGRLVEEMSEDGMDLAQEIYTLLGSLVEVMHDALYEHVSAERLQGAQMAADRVLARMETEWKMEAA